MYDLVTPPKPDEPAGPNFFWQIIDVRDAAKAVSINSCLEKK
jgi:hypothetical protein